ncbi:carbohydrate ABC transporter permease [Dactylosporangium siamense]|uniref:ABC transporter permease n=1 Tax=Dactylosporangium siamense TaxID=685454 RepID=A0A919PNX2_9ACTN|nr:sugar ABC transporter permease [Dactylosporangium siamense]GIG45638.1 ABC transporter permease [Dactylosporangium siamense]
MSRIHGRQGLAGWLFMSPAIIGLGVFMVAPIALALWVSFRDWSGLTPLGASEPAGAANYADLLTDSSVVRGDFAKSLRNNLYYVLGVVPAQTFLAFLLALVVNARLLKGRTFFRTAFYFPSVTSSIAVAFIFIFLFSPTGVVNTVLSAVLPGKVDLVWLDDSDGLLHLLLRAVGVDAAPGALRGEFMDLSWWDWLSGPSVALSSVMILATWTTTGTFMLMFLAGLQNVPEELEEAASIDGASPRQRFFRITLPLLKPTLFLVLTLGIIGTWQVFDQVYAMTSGGPQKTTLTPAYLIYREGFQNSAMGRAAAIAFVVLVIILVFTGVQRLVLRKER